MRFVPQAVVRPGRCAVLPTIAGSHPGGFVDTGSELDGFDNHVYVSRVAFQMMAPLFGWTTTPEQAQEMAERIESLERDNARLAEEVADLNSEFEAIDILASKGFQARKKPGRPPTSKSKIEKEAA